ncbi:MAG: hypothetical protein QOH48_2356 [Actinomycetota bacterium]|jgi:hypothetical protein|nr:hypothetical protein [Actinomycetota bacterium]
MTAAGLGRDKNGIVFPFDEGALERQAPMLQVDILPLQSQELAAAGARCCSQHQDQMKEGRSGSVAYRSTGSCRINHFVITPGPVKVGTRIEECANSRSPSRIDSRGHSLRTQ